MKHERALAFAAFVTVSIVWGTTYLAIRIALETIPPLLLTGVRFTIAGVLMLGIARWRGQSIPTDLRTLGNLALVGFLMVGVGNLAVVWAEQWVPSGLAALFVATAPFWMVIIEKFRKKGERVGVAGMIGMLIGFIGVGMLVTPGGSGGSLSLHFILGALAIQLGSIGWQLGSAHGKYNVRHVGLLASSALQMLSGGLIVTIVGLLAGEGSHFVVNVRTFSAFAYLIVFGSIVAFSSYVYALAHMKTTTVSLYAYINPVVAVFLGWLILSEPLTWTSVMAMLVILTGVAMVQSPGWKKPAPAASEEPAPSEAA